MPAGDPLGHYISREQVLAGRPPARRAQAILFEIESLSARLSAQARRATERYVSEELTRERDLAFLEAYVLGHPPPRPPTIQDIDRFAPQWASLAPARAELRAAVAHALGRKYQFSAGRVPGIRTALALDSDEVQAAYRRFYDEPLASIYAPRLPAVARRRWAGHRLGRWIDGLPPFWMVFALTLTEAVGGGILALPIALAGVGPLPAVVFLVVFGAFNVLTLAYLAETATRDGGVRYGHSFVGQMVARYVGGHATPVVMASMVVRVILTTAALYFGFASTMASATGMPPVVWATLLFAIGFYVVSRGSLNATVTFALVVGAINLALILVLSLLAASQIRLENLAHVNLPFVGGRPFEASLLALIFGVILSAFFGHMSVPASARTVLRRDPSGRALLRGGIAAQIVVVVLYSMWTVVVNGAISSDVMAGETGTALIPLATVVGSSVHVLGSIFVVLGLGMGTIHQLLALYRLTLERLPRRQGPAVTLSRRRARLRLYPPGDEAARPQIGVVYLGQEDDQALFRFDINTGDGAQHVEAAVGGQWDAGPLLAEYLPETAGRRPRLRLALEEADDQSARLRLATTFSWAYETGWDPLGLRLSHLLTLPAGQGELMGWLLRAGRVSLAQAAGYLDQAPEQARASLAPLVAQGMVRELTAGGDTFYEVRLAATPATRLSEGMVEAMGEGAAAAAAAGQTPGRSGRQAWRSRLLDALLSERGRTYLAMLPNVVVFLLSLAVLAAGRDSFAVPLAFNGVVILPILSGVFPVLLLRAGRRRGDIVPGVVYGWLGHPALLAAIFLISLAGVLLHALFIWEELALRASALAVAAVLVWVTLVAWRRGAFARRLVVALRPAGNGDDALAFAVHSGGRPWPVDLELHYSDGVRRERAAAGRIEKLSTLRRVSFEIAPAMARELKVWVYRVTPAGGAEALPATVTIARDGAEEQYDLALLGGQLVQPHDGRALRVEVAFP